MKSVLGRGLFDDPNAPVPDPLLLKCAHVFKTGRRCTKDPVGDGALCVLHGGDEGEATESIRRRMLSLQEQSISVAEDLMVMGDDRVRQSLVVAIWDRTGLGPKSTVAIKEAEDDLMSLSEEELATRAERAAKRFRELAMQKAQSVTDDASDPRKIH